jgi:uncharacterized protein Smg (DUF494 family)
MSLAEMLEHLETLTNEERQMIIDRAMELDDTPLTPEEEKLVLERLAEHDRDPSSAIPLEEAMKRLDAKLRE